MSIESDMTNPRAPAERNVYRMMNMKFLVRYATRQGQAITPESSPARSSMPIVTYIIMGRATMTHTSAGSPSNPLKFVDPTGQVVIPLVIWHDEETDHFYFSV